MLKVVLVQLPIPPLGPEIIRGNVPLAPAYLKHYARRVAGVGAEIEVLPADVADRAGDAVLLRELSQREADLIGFSCYLWNVERSLWLAERLKERHPELRVVIGGPEVTLDNTWVLEHPAIDWAVVGEGEATFADLLNALTGDRRWLQRPEDLPPISGLWNRATRSFGGVRPQLPSLNEVGRVYLDGILDPRWHDTLFLETIRGCLFQCAFCFYPKSFEGLRFMDDDLVLANLELAHQAGISEVFLLDPTLNQRRDFLAFLELLARGNPERRFSYSAELRAEGIRPAHANIMKAANFTEVELGLQSVGREAQELMRRPVNREAFEKGVRALLGAGIRIRADLIVGLPGDTAETIRQGFHYLLSSGLYSEPQVFRLSVLPGTEFRLRSNELGLDYQPHPPYHVLGTSKLSIMEIAWLMREAEILFRTQFDPWPVSDEEFSPTILQQRGSFWEIDLDGPQPTELPDVQIAHTLWIKAQHFEGRANDVRYWTDRVINENPHVTLWIVLDISDAQTLPKEDDVQAIFRACYDRSHSYWDWYFAPELPPGPSGAKRVVVYSSRSLQGRRGWLSQRFSPMADLIEAPECRTTHRRRRKHRDSRNES